MSQDQQERVKDIQTVSKNRSAEYDDGDGMLYRVFLEEGTERGHDEDRIGHPLEKLTEFRTLYFPGVGGENLIAMPEQTSQIEWIRTGRDGLAVLSEYSTPSVIFPSKIFPDPS